MTLLPLQESSKTIYEDKYQLKSSNGDVIDTDIKQTYRRIATALSANEVDSDYWAEQFLWVMEQGALPAGRIIANAGATAYKANTSTINCTVSGDIEDSMDDILSKLHEAGLTLKAGSGIGYCFSTLRPKGATVSGAGAVTSGPIPFMDVYDAMCFTVSSAGNRRGAQMATFDVGHPDVADFIDVKREDGRLRQFNLSLLLTDEFMKAVKHDLEWELAFPLTTSEVVRENIDLGNSNIVWRRFPANPNHVVRCGKTACKTYGKTSAKKLWEKIMQSTYNYSEPGCLFNDRINDFNNCWWCETITATNPCGEQALPPYGSCLLGSINLTRFVRSPFSTTANFDFELFSKVVQIFTRLLDNVIDINGLPLEKQREELFRKRRHGMGYFGLGSALTMMGIVYGSEDAIDFTSKLTELLAKINWYIGIELAKEKGSAPILNEMFTVTEDMLQLLPEHKRIYAVGTQVTGAQLFVLSRYFDNFDRGLKDLILEHGCRFTHATSIAPTGTIALSLGNNASNGIEPSFTHEYARNVIVSGKKTKEQTKVRSYEYLSYCCQFGDTPIDELPDYFISADDVSPKAHIDMQSAAQKWIDSCISKTANVPTDFPYEDFKDIYDYAYSKGLKGFTTFRFNPEVFQGVLVREEDLENTLYEFKLDDGSTVTVKGNTLLEYDGEQHVAANLYDAIKEGYYGKF